ncbi:MAG TPA: galactose mutarotase [Candidatus Faecousia faecipullorum]|nr:galactose mutarotase [Candidatus Faecousia faecipullorum]
MKEKFGVLPSGEEASLYTISCGFLTAVVTDYGATLVKLMVPDKNGVPADVVLGYDHVDGYRTGSAYLGATVGRNANRIGGAAFELNGRTITLSKNDNGNNLHSGPDGYSYRMWKVLSHTDSSISFTLISPNGDQGFPGEARIRVTYTLQADGLEIVYDASCNQDTVFNMTNHTYFNLAGHDHPEAAMDQILTLPGRYFNPDDAENIPTGEQRRVDGTPMDFRSPKPIGQDLHADYEPLHLQNGYDHNFEVYTNPCAILSDPESGRTLAISTDCPGIQLYSGNFLDTTGKGGVHYGKNSGVALETQFAPDSLHHPDWPQPVTPAGTVYHSRTFYKLSW